MSERKITRRSVLAGATVTGIVGSIGGGTVALLQDRIALPGNESTVGSMNLELRTDDNDEGWVDGDTVVVGYGDIEPDDSVTTAIDLRVCDNPGWVWVRTTEAVTTKLAGVLEAELWVDDDCDRVRDEGERRLAGGSLRELSTDLVEGKQVLDDCIGCEPTCLGFQWALPPEDQIDVAIEDAEGPEASLSLEFAAQQCQHNPDPDNPW